MRFPDGTENDGRRASPGELLARRFARFPGPVALVQNPPGGEHRLVGGQDENGRPYSIHLVCIVPGGRRLLVRTKAAPEPADPRRPPPFVTVDTLYDAFALHGGRGGESSRLDRAGYEALPRIPVTVLIDGVPVPGLRVDRPDVSGVELAWDGRTVQCVGEASAIDVLELRSAAPADFR